jgi:hypothetical protein
VTADLVLGVVIAVGSATVLCTTIICCGLFGGNDPVGIVRLGDWLKERRRIIADERIKRAEFTSGREMTSLRIKLTFAEERLARVREIHSSCNGQMRDLLGA